MKSFNFTVEVEFERFLRQCKECRFLRRKIMHAEKEQLPMMQQRERVKCLFPIIPQFDVLKHVKVKPSFKNKIKIKIFNMKIYS